MLITSFKFALVMHKSLYVFSIVSERKLGALEGNTEALRLVLKDENIAEIERPRGNHLMSASS